uniref:HIG1 domain-containing protein n=1 Tax=Rhabditophanes sp. KR3021 TaxID=114890 RepID=A0AC35TWR8_9BILA
MCTVRKYEDPDFIRLPLQPKTVGVIGTSLALFIIKMKNKDQFKGIPSARTSPHSYRPVQPILKKDDNLCVMKEVSTT